MKRFLMSLLCALGITSQSQGETISEEAFTQRFVAALRAAAPDLTITVTGQLNRVLQNRSLAMLSRLYY